MVAIYSVEIFWNKNVKVLGEQLCATLCDPMDCSLPGFSVHGIVQARILTGLPCPPRGDLPEPEIKPVSPVAPELQVESLLLSHQGSP